MYLYMKKQSMKRIDFAGIGGRIGALDGIPGTAEGSGGKQHKALYLHGGA